MAYFSSKTISINFLYLADKSWAEKVSQPFEILDTTRHSQTMPTVCHQRAFWPRRPTPASKGSCPAVAYHDPRWAAGRGSKKVDTMN